MQNKKSKKNANCLSSPKLCLSKPIALTLLVGAVSSAVERLVYTERVSGSIPLLPTKRHAVFPWKNPQLQIEIAL